MKKLFGTDGIRGKANTYPITSEISLQLGKAIAHVFGAKGHGSAKTVVGKDTRLSGYMIETALTSGLVSMGMDVLQVGPLPTPAIAHLIKSMNANCGIVITASHNPADDNGIKLFDNEGYKLPDSVEKDIEKHILEGELTSAHINTEMIGKAYRIDDARGRYIEFAKSSIKNRSLKGLKIVLDCANGAAYWIAPMIFKELGAEVIETAVHPDGYNINKNCGAVYPEHAASLVKEYNADVGISLDGDGDRVIFSDSHGNIINGDKIIGMCALDYKEHGMLSNNTIAVTTMSNMGLHKAMKEAGINTVVTDVGDRNVIECMRENDYNLGGEQSGHIIFMDYVTTGDGILTALHVLKLMADKQKSIRMLADFMIPYPQHIESINVKEKVPIGELPALQKIINECEKSLDESGRVIVRYSGTEKKIRVLLEADSQKKVDFWIKKIKEVVIKELD